LKYYLVMEHFFLHKSIEVGSSVRLKRYGPSAVKTGILWATAEPTGEVAYRSSGRIGERDCGIVLEISENMMRLVTTACADGWISTDKIERIL